MMRWQAWLVAGVAGFVVHGTAWADEPAGEGKPKRPKEARELAHERHEAAFAGLTPEQIERALQLLKAEHPGVAAKGKDGALKLASKDAKALEAALASLETSGVPMGKVWRGVTRERTQEGGDPARAALKKQIHDVEAALAAARAAGAETKAAELERQLQMLHEMKKAMAQMAEDHERARKDGARGAVDPQLIDLQRVELQRQVQALREMHKALADRRAEEVLRARAASARGTPEGDAEAADLLRYLEQMSRPEGERRGPPQHDPALEERMRHARQALEHLQAAGLADQSERVRHALERMERARRDQPGGPRPGAPMRALDVRPLPPPPPHVPPMPPHVGPRGVHRGGMNVSGTLPAGAPPSVGGTRRGPIHQRPCAVPMPPAAPGRLRLPSDNFSTEMPGRMHGSDQQDAEWLEHWVRHPDAVRRDARIPQRFDTRTGEAVEDTIVLVGPDGRRVVKLDRLPKTDREILVIGPDGKVPQLAPPVVREVKREQRSDVATDRAQIERLRAEMDALKKQLQELLRTLDERK